MATKDELQDQLALTIKLNRVIEQMAGSVARIESSYETQSSQLEKINIALNQINVQATVQEIGKLTDSLKGVADQLDRIGSGSEQNLQKVTQGAGEASSQVSTLNSRLSENVGRLKGVGTQSTSIDQVTDALHDAVVTSDGLNQGVGGIINSLGTKLPKAALVGSGAVMGLYQGFQNVVSLTKAMGGFFSTLIGGVTQTSISIAAIPLKIFTGIVDLAASASMGMSEFLQEIENVRKAFGDLKGPTSSTIRDVHKDLKGFSDTGLSTYRIFGTLAERLAYIRENAEAMGAVLNSVRDEWKANGGAIFAFQKGLGITAEQMKSIGQRAIIDGKSMSDFLLDTTKQTLALGKAFGISQKVIGRDMAKAFDDMKHFAQLSVKEIAQASVYAQKLGVELDKIVGTLDQFETFDSAAESAAKLTQSFGVQVDAFKLMEAQNPAEQIDMLRKSFKEAGVDASSFSRQQLKLLESTTGLDAATAKQVFSLNNQGVSLDEIKKKSEVAEKKQLTQAQAMEKLANSIERMIKAGQQQSGSFFDMFIKGIGRGLQASEDFRGTIWSIKLALQQVFYVGIQLGRILPKIVPGLGDILKGMKKFFDPSTFRTLAKGITDSIKGFFKGNKSLSEALGDMRQKFTDFFAVQGPIARDIYDGFKKMFKFGAGVVKESIPLVAEKVKEGLQIIIDFIKDPNKAIEAAKGAGTSEFGFFAGVIMEVGKTLKDAVTLIWPHLKELFTLLFKKAVKFMESDDVKGIFKKALPVVAGFLFGPIFARSVVGALTASLADSAIKAFKGAFGKKAVVGAATQGLSSVVSAASKTPELGKATSVAAQAGQVTSAASPAMHGKSASWGVKDAVRLGAKLVALAGALSVGGVMVAGAIWSMKKILDSAGIKDAGDAEAPLLVMATMVTASVPLAFSLKTISKVGSMKDVLLGGTILSAAVGIVGGVGALLTLGLKNVGTPSQLKGAAQLMGTMTLVFLGMVPLITAATAIGALASGPQAVVLVATAAGMGIISSAVASIAQTSANIVKEVDKMNLSAGFKTKIDAFLGIMNAMQAFTGAFVNIVKATTPSLVELVTGSVESMSDKLNSVSNLIKNMVGRPGGGGLLGVTTIVLDAVKELGVSKGVARSAEVFANIMTATTSLLQAMTPPDAWFEAGNDFVHQLTTGKPFSDLAVDASFYMGKMREGLVELLKGQGGSGGIIGIIGELSTVSIPEPEKASQIARILGTLATMMKSLAPDPKVLEAFSTGASQSAAWGLFETKVKKLDFEGMQRVMSTVSRGFGQYVIPAIKDLVSGIIGKIGAIDPKRIESFKVVGPILTATSTILNAMTSSIRSKKSTLTKDDEKKITTLVTEEAPGLRQVFASMKKELPSLIESLVSTVATVPTGGKFEKHVESAGKLFNFLSSITSIASKLSSGGEGGKELNNDALVHSVSSMAIFLHRIAAGKGAFGTSRAPLVELVDNLSLPVFQRLGQASTRAIKTAEGMNSLVNGLSNVAMGTQDLIKNTSKIEKEGLGTMVSTVREMVERANELETILANKTLNKVNIPTRLKALAKSVGLGSSGRYTIANKDVNITINLSVSMDADDLERTLILRKKSIIRDRLNFATGQGEVSPDRLPEDANAPFQNPIQPGTF